MRTVDVSHPCRAPLADASIATPDRGTRCSSRVPPRVPAGRKRWRATDPESVVCSDAGIDEADAEVGGAFAGGDHRGVLEVLEAHVPQPGEVLAVGHLTVHGDHQSVAGRVDHRQRLLPTGGILRQQHPHGVSSDLDGAVAPGDLADARRGGDCGRRICAQRHRGGYGLSGIAAVGFSGQCQGHRQLRGRRGRRDCRRRATKSASGARNRCRCCTSAFPPRRWVRRCAGS